MIGGKVRLFIICQTVIKYQVIFIILIGHLYFLIFLHKMNNDFHPLSLPPGGKNAEYTNLDYENLNRHKHAVLVTFQRLENV